MPAKKNTPKARKDPAPERASELLSDFPNTGAWAYVLAAILSGDASLPVGIQNPGRLIIVRKEEEDLEDIADGLAALAPIFGLGSEPMAFFGEDSETRLASVERMHSGARVVFATPEGLAAPCPSKREYESRRLRIAPGEPLARKDLLARLEALGYRRADFVEAPGEYAARGAVVDFFPFSPLIPVRALYDGDDIQTLRTFDPLTQVSSPERLEEAVVVPAHEKAGDEPLYSSLADAGLWLVEAGLELPCRPERQALVGGAEGFNFGLRAPLVPPGVEAAAKAAAVWAGKGWKVFLFAANRGEDERLQEIFDPLVEVGAVQHLIGPLREGFTRASEKIAVLSTAQIFERRYRAARAWKPQFAGRARLSFGALKKGDFVVHDAFGVSRYLGLEAVDVGGSDPEVDVPAGRKDGTRRLGREDPEERRRKRNVQDCLRLEFRGGDALFVPMNDFRAVQKYSGAEGHHPRLSSLDARSWAEVKEGVREAVRELAEKLLKTQAARRALPGHAFPEESHMEREFAESFPYEETPDQARAISEVLSDMRAPHPMDRVIVGDVGFGKTEVAMRAALCCVGDARQVCLLVPTTILADQHYRNFKKRFAEYPVRVEMLSRFQTPAQQTQVLKDAAAGHVDIVVGTHRLLQKDVRFQRLGLLVIDEEHRFGVSAKEKLKALKRDVDCLTLSATPIPRTLHQCLSGLRQISLIQSAPTGRQPILTAVRAFDDEHARQAIQDELNRQGQVYYVHNRVRTLPETLRRLQDMLPGVRFCMAHGQMAADDLETTMWDFFQRKYDVLVASSIIESGLDIPSVNTLLVENAQDFGLSQLYQLRGRIGRERRRAYCYLYFPSNRKEFGALSEEARKRLEALRDFGHLGSGLTLAMRDLEIRGAGDLLGAKQSGFLNAVGVEFYSELLDDEISRLKGTRREAEPAAPTHLDLELSAHIPQDYLPGDLERIQFYKRMLAAAGPEDLEKLEKELQDLSGPLPEPVLNLFRVVRIRCAATALGLRTAVQRGSRVEIYFQKDAAVPMEALTRWLGAYEDKMEFVNQPEGDGLRVWVQGRKPLEWLEDFLEGLKSSK